LGGYDLLCVASVLVNGGLTGRFYTHRRGGPPKLIASVRSFYARTSFFFLGAAMIWWLIVDLRRKVAVK